MIEYNICMIEYKHKRMQYKDICSSNQARLPVLGDGIQSFRVCAYVKYLTENICMRVYDLTC